MPDKKEFLALIEDINSHFHVTINNTMVTPDYFNPWCYIYFERDDLVFLMGRNMLIVLQRMMHDATLKDIEPNLDIFLQSLDVCAGCKELRDLSFDKELKIYYIKNDMRSGRYQEFIDQNKCYSILTIEQRKIVLRWISILSQHKQHASFLLEDLVQCWRSFCDEEFPTLDDIK